MTPARSIAPKTRTQPLVQDGADARARLCGVCEWKTATYKHAYQGGGEYTCGHCGATAHLSLAGRLSLVAMRIIVMGAAAFASLFGTNWLTETYWRWGEPPYGLFFIPLLSFSFIWALLIEPKLAPNLPIKWRKARA